MPRPRRTNCNDWENLYGTTAVGNLSQYKIHECVEDVVDLETVQAGTPWVTISDFRYYHFKCPYGDYTTLSGIVPGTLNYAQTVVSGARTMYLVQPVDRAVHAATGGIMIRYSRGSVHGWMCVDPNCPYYLGTVSGTVGGTRYFYI